MAEKWTPGPWRWLGTALVGDHGKRPVVISAGRSGLMLTRGEDGLLRLLREDDAVARLIAAAPTMAAALYDAERYLAHPDVLTIPFARPAAAALDNVRAALALARGEQEAAVHG